MTGDEQVGGLVGDAQRPITASYATGPVRANSDAGGLVGYVPSPDVVVATDSYWDKETTGQTSSAGGGTGLTTEQLRTPTEYGTQEGAIYRNWNVDIYGSGGPDDPWDFGTALEDPALKVDFDGDSDPTWQEFGDQRLPRSPTIESISNGNETITVTWRSPDLGADSEITTFDVRHISDSADASVAGNWTLSETVWTVGDGLEYIVTGLTNSTIYQVQVRTVSTRGPGPWSGSETGQPGHTDYDTDNDGLIEIANLAQLNAMRWDPDGDGVVSDADQTNYDAAFPGDRVANMGCRGGCRGYELTTNLDFDSDGDGDVDADDHGGAYWNGGAGWEPVGNGSTTDFTAQFNGNRHTIFNLFINRPDDEGVGLFGLVASAGAALRNVGLPFVNVTGDEGVGPLVGRLSGGTVAASYAAGSVNCPGESSESCGGLVGRNQGTIIGSVAAVDVLTAGDLAGGLTGDNSGAITASYSTGDVTGDNRVGGLAGRHAAAGTNITASYATGAVTGNSRVGGLVGQVQSEITVSYATGLVTGNSATGGLAGFTEPEGAVFIAGSYWDMETTGQTASVGGGTGLTTDQLQTPTEYGNQQNDIFRFWNVDIDGDGFPDDPWDFGTSQQYPALKLGFDADTTRPATPALTELKVSFDSPVYSVTEGGEAATITVSLDPPADREVSIPITITNEGAETTDYSVSGLVDGALAFSPGDSSKQFQVAANRDNDADDEGVSFGFGTLPGGVIPGDTLTAGLTIADAYASQPVSFTSPATFNVVENSTAVGTVVVEAPIGGGLAVTYGVTGGDDRGKFTIDRDSGALAFNNADTPDVENPADTDTDNQYVVSVSATSVSGNEGVTRFQTITVTVTDVDEPPDKPAAPTVAGAASAGDGSALAVSWTVPDNTGPAISDYDLQYREASWENWIDFPHTGSATTGTITGLESDTAYRVRVLARNDEGESPWSDEGSGSTLAGIVRAVSAGETVATAPVSAAVPAQVRVTTPVAGTVTIIAMSIEESGDVRPTPTGFALMGLTFRIEAPAASVQQPLELRFIVQTDIAARYVQVFKDGVQVGDCAGAGGEASPDPCVSGRGSENGAKFVQVLTSRASDWQTGVALPGVPSLEVVGGQEQITINWSAPDNQGPPTSGYGVQYRMEGDTDWIDHPFSGTGATAVISGLRPATGYEARVRAVNAAGVGEWSPPVSAQTQAHTQTRRPPPGGSSGRTISAVNRPPVFGQARPVSRAVAENAPVGTPVGSPVAAIDADGDILVYRIAGDAAFGVNRDTGQLVVAGPLDHEKVDFYYVRITAEDGRGGSAGVDVGIFVDNVDEPGMIIGVPEQPETGAAVEGILIDWDGDVIDAAWQWQTSLDGRVWSDADGGASPQYTPGREDEGRLLRATVHYIDGHRSGKTAQSVAVAPVLPSPERDPTVVGVTSGPAPAGGALGSPAPDAANPVQAGITVSQAGWVTIIGRLSEDKDAPAGYSPWGAAFHIIAPGASADTPLRLSFLVTEAPSLESLALFRDGQLVAPCAAAPGRAEPDPCIAERRADGETFELAVASSQPGEWQVALAAPMEEPTPTPTATPQPVIPQPPAATAVPEPEPAAERQPTAAPTPEPTAAATPAPAAMTVPTTPPEALAPAPVSPGVDERDGFPVWLIAALAAVVMGGVVLGVIVLIRRRAG